MEKQTIASGFYLTPTGVKAIYNIHKFGQIRKIQIMRLKFTLISPAITVDPGM